MIPTRLKVGVVAAGSIRPCHRDRDCRRWPVTEPEDEPPIRVGKIGAATIEKPGLRHPFRCEFDPPADEITMVRCLKINADPAGRRTGLVAKHRSRLVDIADDEIDPAIIIEITCGQTTAVVW